MRLKLEDKVLLQVDNLTIFRGNTMILNNVSWRIIRDEHWVILGANGCGKTSLLSALTGYLTPSEGEIEVLGERYGSSDWRDLRTSIGIVSSSVRQMMADSEPALDTVASGKYAMIDFWGSPRGSDVKQAKAILRQIGCEYLADRPWGVLSQGERQRVLIGRALMSKPAILILDEPCAGLDPVAREHFLDFITKLGRSRNCPTLVLVTHHVEEIKPVFSHVLLLKEGRVVKAGSKKDMLRSSLLSEVFGAPVQLNKDKRGYALHVRSGRRGKIV